MSVCVCVCVSVCLCVCVSVCLVAIGSSKISKRFIVPRQHSLLRIRTTFVKIDLWDGARAWLMVDGVEVWARTFTCDVIIDGMCGNTSRGSLECGLGDRSDEAESIDIVVPHSLPTVTLEFHTDLPGEKCLGFWVRASLSGAIQRL